MILYHLFESISKREELDLFLHDGDIHATQESPSMKITIQLYVKT